MSVRQGQTTRIFGTAVIIVLMLACAAAIVSQRQYIRARWVAWRLAQAENPEDLARYSGILAAMGPSAVRPAVGLLDNTRPDIRVLATLIVGRLGGAAGIDALFHALSDPEPDVRVAAASQLGLMPGSDRLVARLADIVRSQPRPIAMAAVLAIEKIPAAGASVQLIAIAHSNPDAAIRAQAVESMGRRRDPTARAALIERLSDDAAVDVQLLGEFRDEQAIRAVAEHGKGLPATQSAPRQTVAAFAERSLEQLTGTRFVPTRPEESPAIRIESWRHAKPLDPTTFPADLTFPTSE